MHPGSVTVQAAENLSSYTFPEAAVERLRRHVESNNTSRAWTL